MQLNYFSKVLVAFLLALTCSFSSSMIVGKVQGDSFISLNGDINKGDLEKWIIPAFKNVQGKKYIFLNSTGGDVEEAMKIGRYFKKNEFSVSVAYKNICYSSCVFLLAGGVDRGVGGEVGIHRPYFGSLDKSLTTSQIKEFREKINLNLKTYLTEMDINPSLVDVMNSYPPEKMKILSDEELRTYRLNIEDANFEEKEVAKVAYSYNMTSSEWRVRSANARSQCEGVKTEFCFATKILNISKSEFQIRLDRMEKCKGDTDSCFRKHVARGEK
jgi:hypothetical protein